MKEVAKSGLLGGGLKRKKIEVFSYFLIVYYLMLLLVLPASIGSQNPAYLFAKRIGGGQGGEDIGQDISVDSLGNIFVTGFFSGSVDFDPSGNSAYLTSEGGNDIFLAKYDSLGNYLWAISIGGGGNDSGTSIGVDDDGNVLVTGYFDGTADFDPSFDQEFLVTSIGSDDIFIAKYTYSGSFLWAKTISGTNGERGISLQIGGNGDIYLTGNFSGTTDFDPSSMEATLTSVGGYDIFVAKYSFSGEYVWAKAFGGLNADSGRFISIDSDNNVYLTGYFSGVADFDPSENSANLISVGIYDIFLTKYDSSGNYLWAKNMGGTIDGYGESLALDNSGNIYVTGYFRGAIDFDPSAAISNISSMDSYDIFIAKYDKFGNYVWAEALGGPGADIGQAIALGENNNIYVTGYFNDSVDFDPSPDLFILGSLGGSDIFLSKYDSSGNYLLAINMGGTGGDQGWGVALDQNNNVHITGYFHGIADFDPSLEEIELTSVVGISVFVAKYSFDGIYFNAFATLDGDGGEDDNGNSIVADESGNLYLTGNFWGTVDFNPSIGVDNLISSGNNPDIFLAKYDNIGNFVWAGKMGGNSSDYGMSVAIDGDGNLIITGSFEGIADFDPSPEVENLTNFEGGSDVYIAKYDNSGDFLWAANMGGTGSGIGQSVAIDGDKSIVVTGYFEGTIDFDPSPSAQVNLTSAGMRDVFLAKYDSYGNLLWASRLGGTYNDWGYSVALDTDGNVLITGAFEGMADFDPSSGEFNLNSFGDVDIFIAKYDEFGNLLWARGMGGPQWDQGRSIAIDGVGNSYITGDFRATADFNPAIEENSLTSDGLSDIFLAKFDNDGIFVWAKRLGGTDDENGRSVAIDGNGNVFATGFFSGVADFDPSEESSNLISFGYYDVFLAKYNDSGDFLGAGKIGGSNYDYGRSVAIDGFGNACVVGVFKEVADFDPSPSTELLSSSAGGFDMFYGKYTTSCTSPSFINYPEEGINSIANSAECTSFVDYEISVSGFPAPEVTYYFSGSTLGNGIGTGSGSLFNLGTTTVLLIASNDCGSATITFSITVTDTEAPEISLLGDSQLTVCKNDTYFDLGAIALDDCDGDLTGSIVQFNPVNTSIPGLYTVTFNVEDISGNPAIEVVRSIEVVECTEDYDISINDPCTCLDNATTLADGQFSETVQVSGPSGDIWTVVLAPGLYQLGSQSPPIVPMPVTTGTTLTEVSPGVFTLSGKHVDAEGYSIQVTNGLVTLSISNTCYYPNPSIGGLNAIVCSNKGPQIATVTAQLGGEYGAAPVESILFELIRQDDDIIIDFQLSQSDTYFFDPSTLDSGDYALRVTFEAADGGSGHPGCKQTLEKNFEVRAVGCGGFPWDGN